MRLWFKRKCIIEQRVSNCSARNDCFSVGSSSKRRTISRWLFVGISKSPQKLFIVTRLDITSVVLIEIGQLVVHEDFTFKWSIELEFEATFAEIGEFSWWICNDVISASYIWDHFIVRSDFVACCVVDFKLRNLQEIWKLLSALSFHRNYDDSPHWKSKATRCQQVWMQCQWWRTSVKLFQQLIRAANLVI